MAECDLTLYYFPGSYYSLKVLLFLYEKGIPFKEQIINIHNGDQNADWYIKMNPMAEVPVVQHGSNIVVESEAILDYLESLYPDSPFIPNVTSEKGKAVQAFRTKLQALPIDHLTYGVFMNPQFRTRELPFPKFALKKFERKRYAKTISRVICKMQEKLWANPEPQEELKVKLTKVKARAEAMFDVDRVTAVVDDLNPVLDEIEDLLKAAKKGTTEADDYWLFGANFCVADVFAVIFLYRLEFICIDDRFFSTTKRPLVNDYYKRLRARSSVQRMIAVSRSVPQVYIKSMLKRTTVKTAKIGILVGMVGLGFWGYKRCVKG